MMCSICGANCFECGFRDGCNGCLETNGAPFGKPCLVAACCRKGEGALRELKKRLVAAFNRLDLPDMEEVTELYALKGSVVNMEYTLSNGETVRFWEDDKIYLGCQLPKQGSDRCYGLTADEQYLMVSEYSSYGADAEIIVYKQWNGPTCQQGGKEMTQLEKIKGKIDTYCGLCCQSCDLKDSMGCGGCIATKGHPFHGECALAQCTIRKNLIFCGECPDFPCQLLESYSSDPEHGDTPPGMRVEACAQMLKEIREIPDGI